MNSVAKSLGLSPAFGMFLASCHPFGCGSDQCVKEHFYTDARHCHSVQAAASDIIPTLNPADRARFDTGALADDQSWGVEASLESGTKLGLSHAAVFKDLQQDRIAYLRSFNARAKTSRPADILFHDLTECRGDQS